MIHHNVIVHVRPAYDQSLTATADTLDGLTMAEAQGTREDIAVNRCICAARAAGHFVLRVVPIGGVAKVAERIGLTLVGRMG